MDDFDFGLSEVDAARLFTAKKTAASMPKDASTALAPAARSAMKKKTAKPKQTASHDTRKISSAAPAMEKKGGFLPKTASARATPAAQQMNGPALKSAAAGGKKGEGKNAGKYNKRAADANVSAAASGAERGQTSAEDDLVSWMLNFDKAFSQRTGEVITGGGTALPGEDLEIVRQEVAGLSGPTSRAAASASAGIFGSTSFANIRGCTADFESEDEQTPAAVEKQTPSTPVAVEQKPSGVAGSMKKEKPMMKKQNLAVAKKKSLPEKPSTGHQTDVCNKSGAGNAVKHAQAAAEEAGDHSEGEGDKKFHELSFAEQMERVLNSNIQPKKRAKPLKVPKKADKKDEDAAPDAAQAKREELLARKEREQKVLADTTTASKLQILVSDKKSAKEFFADDGFSAIGDSLLDARLVKQLEFLTFRKMTSIQAEAVPQCLANSSHDVLLKAPTGSGKTLAFLVPALNKILTVVTGAPVSREEGVLGVVLSPTKELSNQSMQVCEKLTRMLPWLVCGSLSGGENPKSEKARIRKGLHLVFATPGRLNYHLENTHSWKVSERFQCFVLDEADRLLDMGFEKQIKVIYKSVVRGESSCSVGPNFSTCSGVGGNPNYAPIGKGNKPVAMASRQTMLVSATLTPAVQRLAEWCLDKEKRLIIGFGERAGKSIANAPAGDLSALVSTEVDDEVASWSLPANLTQHVLVTPTKTRLPCLISLLLKHSGKVIVFFSSCASVDFHYDLFVGLKWPQSMKKDTDKQETKTFRGGFVGLKRDADDDSEEEFVNSDDEGVGIVDEDNEQDGKARRPVKKKQRRNYAGGNSTSVAQQETGFIGKKASLGGNADDVGMPESSSIPTTRPNAPIHSSANPKAAKSSTPVFEQIGLFKLHGNLTADERTGFLKDFAQRDKAVLLASDVVARGIDLPKIEYIVQYDPPQHLEEYLHRIGRTARCGNSGNAVLFLQPSEEVYLHMLQQKIDPTTSSAAGSGGDAAEMNAGVDVWRSGDQGSSNVGNNSCATSGGGNGSKKVVHRMSCEKLKFNLRQFAPLHFQNLRDCAEFLQSQMIQGAVDKSRQLSHLARRAFLSWMKAYSTFPRALKPVFNVKALHPGHVATSFGLSEAPREIAAHYRKDSSVSGGGGEDAGGKKGGKKGKGKETAGGSVRDSFGAEGKGGGKKGGKGFGAKKPTLGERLAKDKKQRHGDALREQRSERLFVRKEKAQKGTRRGSGGGSLKGMDSFC